MRAFVRKAMTATVTFSVALGIGFVMQYGDALAARLGVDEPVAGPVAREAEAAPFVVTTPQATVAAAPLVPRPSQDADNGSGVPLDVAAPAFDAAELDLDPTPEVPPAAVAVAPAPVVEVAVTCQPAMTAAAQPLAIVRLTLTAPCHPDTPVTFQHEGMKFSALTDAGGDLTVDVPALSRDAMFLVALPGEANVAAFVQVDDFDTVNRAVLQWRGEDGVQLHALEFGAGYDDAGHVFAASAGSADAAVAGTGGMMTVLGDPRVSDALRAEVYTFPKGQTLSGGAVRLTVEAEVTLRNCGRAVSAQSIQVMPDSDAAAVDLTMTMPDCDAVGEFLVLNNMFGNLTLAGQ